MYESGAHSSEATSGAEAVVDDPDARPVQGRVLGKIVGDPTGPTMVVLGGIHGNEPSGVIAVRRVLERLHADGIRLRGTVIFLAGNLTALARRSRFIDLDLNRIWTPGRVHGLFEDAPSPGEPAENREQRELVETLRGIVDGARGQLFFLDLHTSSSDGPPFLTVGDTLRNRRFAQQFPLPLILGLEEQVDGALLELLNNHGFITMGVEAGQHDAAHSPDIHEAVVWMALAGSGVMEWRTVPELDRWKQRLQDAARRSPRIVEVRHRHAITDSDEFRMEPGYRSFDPVTEGTVVAHDRHGPIAVPEDGMLLLPLYQGQGDDGFFVAREVKGFWLRVSATLRLLRISRALSLLPGVRRDPERSEVYVIDTRIARYYPLEIFHLFGFRKLRDTGNELVVSRRRYDLEPPQQVSFSYPRNQSTSQVLPE